MVWGIWNSIGMEVTQELQEWNSMKRFRTRVQALTVTVFHQRKNNKEVWGKLGTDCSPESMLREPEWERRVRWEWEGKGREISARRTTTISLMHKIPQLSICYPLPRAPSDPHRIRIGWHLSFGHNKLLFCPVVQLIIVPCGNISLMCYSITWCTYILANGTIVSS